MEKQCYKCKIFKKREEFCPHKKNKDGLDSYCKKCSNESRKKWAKLNRAKLRQYEKKRNRDNPEIAANKKLREKYGITYEQKKNMIVSQNYKCANKGCPEVLSTTPNKNACVDHDHDTNKVRAILCSICNRTLGMLKEDVIRIRGLANYIKRFK